MDDTQTQNTQTRRIAIALVMAIVIAATGWWFWRKSMDVPTAPAATPPAVAAAAAPAEPVIKHPIDAAVPVSDVPAPVATDPDAALLAGLGALFGAEAVGQWLIPEQLLRRIVATTDNLARNARIEPLRPVRPPVGAFIVQRELLDATAGTDRITLDARNFARYDGAVQLLAKTDMAQAALLYRQMYPLLQRSYEDLGYPERYFNDRVVEVIDHLLATPEAQQPLLLEQPKVLYRFADAELEARSAGQKLLLRMGVAHMLTTKQKLREFRAQIVNKE